MDKKKVSVFNITIFMILTALSIGFLINNILTYDKLAKQNRELRVREDEQIRENLKLKIEIEKLSSFERIKKLAAERLGMIYADSAIIKNELIVIPKIN